MGKGSSAGGMHCPVEKELRRLPGALRAGNTPARGWRRAAPRPEPPAARPGPEPGPGQPRHLVGKRDGGVKAEPGSDFWVQDYGCNERLRRNGDMIGKQIVQNGVGFILT